MLLYMGRFPMDGGVFVGLRGRFVRIVFIRLRVFGVKIDVSFRLALFHCR